MLFEGVSMSTINGTPGNDTLPGTAGDDQFNGGLGFDTAQIAAPIGSATFSVDAQNHWVVSSPQGTDTMSSIEALQFADGTIQLGAQFRINTTATGNQFQPVSVGLADGGFATAWAGPAFTGGLPTYGIYMQRVDANGMPVGPETLVSSSAGSLDTPSIARLTNGSYVISWNTGGDIHAQLFDANGGRIGGEALVNVDTFDTQRQGNEAIAPLNDGGYMIMWASPNQGMIEVQAFDATGVARPRAISGFGPFDAPDAPAIAARWDGGAQVVWRSGTQQQTMQITQEAVDNRGVPETLSSDVASGSFASNPHVAQLPDGGWIIAWSSNADIYMQRFDQAGASTGPATLVSTSAGTSEFVSSVAVLADGSSVVAWLSATATGVESAYVQRYDAAGAALGDPTLVSVLHPFTRTPINSAVNVAALADGGFLVSFTEGDTDQWGVFGERFDASGVAVSGGRSLLGDEHDNVIRFGGAPLAGGPVTFDGGAGIDRVVLPESVNDVQFYELNTRQPNLTTANGTKVFTSIERVQFSDALFALDTHAGEHTWQAAALFHAGFGVLPGIEDLSHWTAQADRSSSMGDLGQHMIDFYAPGVSSHDLVAYLYQQLTHQVASEDVIQGYVDEIGPGKTYATEGDLFAYAANLPVNTTGVVSIVGTAQALDPAAF
jgi:hypothetical protein